MKSISLKLLAIQKELLPIKKEGDNPFFKSTYLTLDSVLAVLRPLFNKHGVVVLQPLHEHNGRMCVATIIADTETEEQLYWSVMLPDLTDPQKTGAAISYFRRFCLVSLFMLESLDDDAESIVRDVQKAFSKPKEEAPLTQEDPFYVPAPPQENEPVYTEKTCVTCGSKFRTKYSKAIECFPCHQKALKQAK